MKTINVRQNKEDFIQEYHRAYHNPYFNAVKQVMELINKAVYIDFEKISYTYDENGLTYFAVGNKEGDLKIIYSVKGK